MNDFKKYIVVSAFSSSELVDTVNGYIEKGYIPMGGVAVLSGHFKDNAGRLYQSMLLNDIPIKATKEEEKAIINVLNEKIYFCPKCNTIIEEYKKGIWGCGNEDCGYETDNIENLIEC